MTKYVTKSCLVSYQVHLSLFIIVAYGYPRHARVSSLPCQRKGSSRWMCGRSSKGFFMSFGYSCRYNALHNITHAPTCAEWPV